MRVQASSADNDKYYNLMTRLKGYDTRTNPVFSSFKNDFLIVIFVCGFMFSMLLNGKLFVVCISVQGHA